MPLALLILLAATPPIVATPFCLVNEKTVLVHVSIASRWQTKEGKQESASTIWQLNCDRATKQCDGAKLSADLKKGKDGAVLVDMMQLGTIVGATLQSDVGSVAVISWGVYLFVLDVARNDRCHLRDLEGRPPSAMPARHRHGCAGAISGGLTHGESHSLMSDRAEITPRASCANAGV